MLIYKWREEMINRQREEGMKNNGLGGGVKCTFHKKGKGKSLQNGIRAGRKAGRYRQKRRARHGDG